MDNKRPEALPTSSPEESGSMMVALPIAAVLIIFGAMFYGFHVNEKRRDERDAQYVKDCQTLGAKYGQFFEAKEGPFSGVPMIASDFGNHTVVLKVAYSGDDKERRFLCGDLKRTKDPIK